MNMPFSLGFRSSLFLVTFLLLQSAASAQTALLLWVTFGNIKILRRTTIDSKHAGIQ